MSKVIENVRTEFPEFWKLPITKSHKNYNKTYFDEVNASLIFEQLAESNKSDDLVLDQTAPYSQVLDVNHHTKCRFS